MKKIYSDNEVVKNQINNLIKNKRYSKLILVLNSIGKFDDNIEAFYDKSHPFSIIVKDKDGINYGIDKSLIDVNKDYIIKYVDDNTSYSYEYMLDENNDINYTFIAEEYIKDKDSIYFSSDNNISTYDFTIGNININIEFDNNKKSKITDDTLLFNMFKLLMNNNINFEKIYNQFFKHENRYEYDITKIVISYKTQIIGYIIYNKGNLYAYDLPDKLDISNKFKNKLLLK